MAYNPDKKYSTGIESNYLCITAYKIDRISEKILVELSYFAGTDRTYKKPVEKITQPIRLLTITNKSDILKEIYNELNNISPYKEYFEKDGIK